MKYWKFVSVVTALLLSMSANASIIRTLNGVSYEWLEVTATQGISRPDVQTQIDAATSGDQLYGYEYASRALVEALFSSYFTPDTLTGWHGNSNATAGINAMIVDFGATKSFEIALDFDNYPHIVVDSTDRVFANPGSNAAIFAIYGLDAECNNGNWCEAKVEARYDDSGLVIFFNH